MEYATINSIIIYGAGASKACGAPLQRELFQSMKNLNIPLKDHPQEDPLYVKAGKKTLKVIQTDNQHRFSQFQIVRRFFQNQFNIVINEEGEFDPNIRFPTFEEVLGLIYFANNRGDFLEPQNDIVAYESHLALPQKQEYSNLESEFNCLIGQIIKDTIETTVGQKNHYKELFSHLKPEGLLHIPLNYDILCDNAIISLIDLNQNSSPRNIYLDYHIPIKPFSGISDFLGLKSNVPVHLFKIHGSLNWLYCHFCNQLYHSYNAKFASKEFYEPVQCPVCNSNLFPFLVPPTFFKNLSNLYIESMWHDILSIVSKNRKSIKNIIFCGYSFPDADIHFKYLLKRIESFLNQESDLKRKVLILNRDEKEDEKDRYLRFFRKNSNFKIDYKALSFEKFAKNPQSELS